MGKSTSSLSTSLGNAGLASGNADLTGQTLGDFKISRRLGQGGMGQVYLAEQISLKRNVALKILKPDLAANDIALTRFKREAQHVARATHANIVQVCAIDQWEGLHYMALEYVEGFNLREYLIKKGPPQVPLALSIMRQVASALAEANEHGIVHRDIKPENILLTRKGQVKVADFGLARSFTPDQQTLHLTQSGVTMGTPLYMSPEQVQGQTLDARTDIYSFGVTCYHMLAGEPPFKGETPFEVALQHVQSQAKPLAEVRPDLPAELGAVVGKMMAKQPADRYQTARELLQDVLRLRNSLTAALKGKSSSISLVATGVEPLVALEAETSETLKLRRWLPWAVTASILLALFMGAAVGFIRGRPTSAANVSLLAKEPSAAASDLDRDGSLALKEKEKRLRQAAKDYANPGNDRAIGISHQVELAVFLLDQRRYEDADRFFKELSDNSQKVPMYALLGRIGHAVVLAFQDKAAESMKILDDVFTERPRNLMMLRAAFNLMNQYPHLHREVADAIKRNEDNNQKASAILEKVSKPEQLILPAEIKPKQKAANKGVG
ncbi:MAG TPA: protein kinase [Gemmataceae bacterium]|nr:protein kinase [Gemmataceae bacterium]